MNAFVNHINTRKDSEREYWIDALRGFCMFLVVFMHIENFSIGLGTSESVVMQVVFTCFLTTFFFISGYVAYRKQVVWSLKYIILKLKDKLIQLLIPALIVSNLYNICFEKDVFIFFSEGFHRYWFLIVLFETFICFYFINWINYLSKNRYFEIILITITIFIIIIPTFITVNGIWREILSINNLSIYFPFFVIGVLSRKYQFLFERIIFSENLITLGLLSFVIIEYVICSAHTTDMYVTYGKIGYLMQITVKYIATYILIALFYRNSKIFQQNTRLIKSLCLLGRQTLDIYLLHWFFIPTIPTLYIYVQNGINPIFEIVFSSIIATIVILVAWTTGIVIKNSKWLSKWLLGTRII